MDNHEQIPRQHVTTPYFARRKQKSVRKNANYFVTQAPPPIMDCEESEVYEDHDGSVSEEGGKLETLDEVPAG